MSDSRTLSMKFRKDDEKNTTLTVADPKEDLTATTVKAAMNAIILDDIFDLDGASLTAPAGATITTKTEQVLF